MLLPEATDEPSDQPTKSIFGIHVMMQVNFHVGDPFPYYPPELLNHI
jgi:hypothetical protein